MELDRDSLFIGTTWAKPATDAMIEVVSPDTEEVVARVPEGSAADIDAAVAAARRAFDEGPWPRMSPAERIEVVQNLSALYAARLDDMALVISTEMGSPISFSSLAQAPAPWMQIEAFLGIAREFPWEATRPGALGGDVLVPHGREEEWRFTPLERLRGLHDGTAEATGGLRVEVTAPEGVIVETVDRTDARIGKAGKPVDRVAAQAFSAFEKASVITVPKETVLTEPVRIAVHGEGGTVFGHQVVELGAFAEAVVVIDHTGDGTLAANVEFLIGDGAKLTVVSVQDWDDSAVHVAQHTALIGRDATFKSVVVTFGGDVVRLHPRVIYGAPGGEAELFGLYFTDQGQHQEHRLFIDHDTPHCRSNVAYKGALQGQDAHAVWIGDVLIRAAAEGTDTYELNRNLVLTDGARVDSVPNLEIETGEIVGAGHASATGRFDDEQLFYLMSRGIGADEARRLVVRGFFGELVQQIGLADLEERLMASIDAELKASVG